MSTFFDNFHAPDGTVINTGAYTGNSGATYGNLTGQTLVNAVISGNAPYSAVDATAAFAVASFTLGADDPVSAAFTWNGTGSSNNRIDILYRAKVNGSCYDIQIESIGNVLALYWISSSAVRTFLSFVAMPTLTSAQSYTLNCEPSGTTQAFSFQRASDNNYWNPSGSWQSGHVAILSTTDGNVTGGGSPGFFVGAASTESNVMALTAIWGGPAPTTATLTGPTTGSVSAQSTAFTVNLDNPAGPLGEVVTPASSGSGDTIQAAPSGGNVTTITIPQGATTGTFYQTSSATPGARNISITTSPALTYSGSPIAYTASSSSATSYTLTGPSGGALNVASTNFTVTPNGLYTGIITPHTTGAGTFGPTFLNFAGTSDPQTFTYTPTTTTGSPHTISTTASPSLGSNPAGIPYTVSALGGSVALLDEGYQHGAVSGSWPTTPAVGTASGWTKFSSGTLAIAGNIGTFTASASSSYYTDVVLRAETCADQVVVVFYNLLVASALDTLPGIVLRVDGSNCNYYFQWNTNTWQLNVFSGTLGSSGVVQIGSTVVPSGSFSGSHYYAFAAQAEDSQLSSWIWDLATEAPPQTAGIPYLAGFTPIAIFGATDSTIPGTSGSKMGVNVSGQNAGSSNAISFRRIITCNASGALTAPTTGTLSIASSGGTDTLSFASPTAGTNPVGGALLFVGSTPGGESGTLSASDLVTGSGSFTHATGPSNYYVARTFDLAYPPNLSAASNEVNDILVATGYAITGPTGGVVNVASTNFAATLNGLPTGTQHITITPSGGGLSTPIVLAYSGSTTTRPFSILPTAVGEVTLTLTSSPQLGTDPTPIPYTVAAVPTTQGYFSDVEGFAPNLSTVGYTVFAQDGSIYAARTTSGVITDGVDYSATISLPFSGSFRIRWDDGANPVTHYATDVVARLAVDITGINLEQAIAVILAGVAGEGGIQTGNYLAPDRQTPRMAFTAANGQRTSTTQMPPT